jgi:3D (Asp-Asp-Asp) domain-containing protein
LFVKRSLLILSVFAQAPQCSAGWWITGYYVPDEKDYAPEQILVFGGRWLPRAFVRAAQMEGFGLTRAGDYAGYDGKFYVHPLTSTGRQLSAAVDPRVIRYGTRFRVGNHEYVATDTGGAIRGRHIDLFMGYGRAGERAMKQLGQTNATVCFE